MKTPWSATDLELDELWADPESLALSSPRWSRPPSITNVGRYLDAVPNLFAERPVVLAHGDFAPVNVLTDGEAVTGLLDFEAVRLADPPLDVAWWAWSASFSPAEVLDMAWPAFLDGAGIDAAEPRFCRTVRVVYVLRMLEQLATGTLAPDIARIVRDRCTRTDLTQPAPQSTTTLPAVTRASGAFEVGTVELAECFPVPGVRFRAVGLVVGHRESVVGGVELQCVVHSSVSERAFQQLGSGERVVVPGAGHVDCGGDTAPPRGEGSMGRRRQPACRRGTTPPRRSCDRDLRLRSATCARPGSTRWYRSWIPSLPAAPGGST